MTSNFKAPQAYETTPRPPIALHPVESHKVAAIGYDDATQTLAVTFRRSSGQIYHYPNVTRETFEAFRGAESIGRYFGQHLQALPFKKYPAETVPA
jgi:hypothetical protein